MSNPLPYAGRTAIGSDAVIAGASAYHLFKAAVLLTTRGADTTVPLAALLATFRTPELAALALVAAALMAAAGVSTYGVPARFAIARGWGPLPPHVRLMLLVPQQTLLVITAFGAVLATTHGIHQPHCWVSRWYTACNQMPRLIMPFLYTAAIHARCRSA